MPRHPVFAPALLLALLAPYASAQAPEPPAASTQAIDLRYVGDTARLGIGYDTTNKLRADGLLVFGEQPASNWIGEFWASDRSAGGLQLSYHWRPADATGDASVRKLFAAVDQNQQHDRKVTVGGGFESNQWFGAAYIAAGISGRRETSSSSQATTATVTGTDAGGIYQKDFVTTTVVNTFQRGYNWGVGGRAGHFYEGALLRLQAGADYEWGQQSTSQATIALGAEKYFEGTPHSVALSGELYWKHGEADPSGPGGRVVAMYRYSFDGPSYRPARTYRMVAVESPVVAAPTPTAAQSAPPQPRIEKQIVKTTASVSTDTFFELDSAKLRAEGRVALDAIIAQLRQGRFEGNIHVVGHTCNLGSAAYNQKLSDRRASAVRDYLVAGGIPTSRILAEGMGLREPRFPNDATGRPKNRRVDIEFVTLEERVKEVTLPPLPEAAAPAKEATPVPKVEWRREEIATEPAWLRRALRNPVAHKQSVDVYTTVERTSSVAEGAKRYVSRPPVAQSDTFTVERDSSRNRLDVLANDSDPDGKPLSIASVTVPAHGSATIDGNGIVYTPTPGYVGADTFSYKVVDPDGLAATAQVTVTVTKTCLPPVANFDYSVAGFNQPVNINVLVNDGDPEGLTLTVVSFTQPANGTVTRGPGNSLTYRSKQDYIGMDAFRYTISNSCGATASAEVSVYADP